MEKMIAGEKMITGEKLIPQGKPITGENLIIGFSALVVFVGLYLASLYNYLLFHSVAEVFSIVIACGIFMVAWNTRRHVAGDYLLLIGIAYLFVGILDFVHTLSYADMNIFIDKDANVPTQLWIAARYMESLTLLAAPFALHRRIRSGPAFLVFGTVTAVIFLSIFAWRIFPDCFLPEAGGLTPFKKISEYVICLILLAAGLLVLRHRVYFDPDFSMWLLMSITTMVFSELAFTTYVGVFGVSNLIGHYLKIVSFYCMYKAVIETGLTKPHDLLFRNLQRQRESLRQSEAAVRRHLAEIEAIYQNAPVGMCVLDRDLRFVRINARLAETNGFPAEAHIGRTIREIVPGIVDQVEPAMQRLFATGCPVMNIEVSGETAAMPGVVRTWVESWLPMKDADSDGIIGLNVVAQEITEQKKTEEMLKHASRQRQVALDAARMGWWHYDPATRIASWDDRYKEIFGVSGYSRPNDDILARLHPEDLPDVLARVAAALDPADTKPYTAEYRINLPDGSVKWIKAHGIALFEGPGADKRATEFVGTVADVTDRRRTQEALQQLNEMLEQRVAERTELANARSKQLQSLAVQLIEAEERERRRIAQLLHDDLQQILASAKMQLQAAGETLPATPLLTNVEYLLQESIAKARRLSHELSPAVLHHSGLPAGLKWLCGQMDEQFGLSVALETHAVEPFMHTPLKVFIFRSVQELLFNTVKHAGVKRARVVLAGSPGGLDITVCDEGCGFDPDRLHHAAEQKGFGLLSISERAASMGGSLIIDSVPGRGSRFTMTIPFEIAGTDLPAGLGPPAEKAPQAPAANAPHTKVVRVLFADDHKVMRQGLIGLIAGQPGIEVVGEAADGCQAVELARQLNPDVIVMDVSMPRMDGVEATRRIKTEFPGIRIIGLSMMEDAQIIETLRAAGAQSFLSKTVSSAELLKEIYRTTENENDRKNDSHGRQRPYPKQP